jgi:SAM-dependent methyltransferase
MSENPPSNRYGSIAAEVYDVDKPIGRLADTAFFLKAIEGIDGPVLEPACGSGRLLIPVLEAGHAAVGFDTSEEMLERCRARLAERGLAADVSIARFEDFDYGADRFGAIIVPAGSFSLVNDYDDARATLGRFAKALKLGGRLVLDLVSIGSLANADRGVRSWKGESGDHLRLEAKHVASEFLNQLTRSRFRYERWRNGKLVAHETEDLVQRAWGLREFSDVLSGVGFEVVRYCGGYDPSRPAKDEDMFITFEARRVR